MSSFVSKPKLELLGVGHEFVGSDDARLTVLRDITFDVASGEFLTIIGGSGSGKTTLLRIVDHLIIPTTGSIFLDSKPVGSPGGKISFVFQSDCLLPWRTVADNVAYGLELRGVSRKEARSRAGVYLALVGLKPFSDYYPHQLSGGMRQRVNLARALAVEPEILLMDEPFAALDAQTRELMQLELLRIWEETGKTILFVTHQLDEAVFLADRVVALSARPGSVREIVPITLPKPRTIETKRSIEFQHYVSHLWTLIELDVRRSFQEEVAGHTNA